MSGPSDAYLAQFAPLMMPGPGASSTMPLGPGAPNTSGFPSLTDLANVPSPAPIQAPPLAPDLPPMGPPPAPPGPPPNMSLPTDDPSALVSRQPPMPASPNMSVAAPPAPAAPPPQSAPDPHAFPLISAGGGGSTPAHEVERRGPSLLAAQGLRNDTTEAAIDTVAARNDAAAQDEYGMALQQEREARAREQAIQRSIAERDEEMQQRQQDFDASVQQMSEAGHVDQGRFWSSRSTPQKIAGVAELLLAGFRGAPSMLTKRIDDDVRAQEFAFYATRDTANAKQNAFGMAMQKYQNVDAARAMATAASIGVTQAQLGQIAANWKGTDAANRASEAIAQLQNEKMAQIANGVQFVPAQARGPVYIDPETGLPYDLAGAQKVAAVWRDNRHARGMKNADIGGQLLVQKQKSDLENPGGMSKEARSKLIEKDTANQEFNAQADRVSDMLNGDLGKKFGLVPDALAKLGGPRVTPESTAFAQQLKNINLQLFESAIKTAKDSEGRISPALLEKLEDYQFKPGDTPALALQKLQGIRDSVNAQSRQLGADAPRPNGEMSRAAQDSLKVHGK